MDTNEQIVAYRAWLATTPKIIRVAFSTNVRIALTPQSLWDAVQEAFSLNLVPTPNNINNTESLDGFQAWYNQIYLPSQV